MATSNPRILVLDVESTTFQKGNPFSRRNSLCAVAARLPNGEYKVWGPVYHPGGPFASETLVEIENEVRSADLIVGFNLKFDLHWLRRYGIIIPMEVRLWDCQAVQFLFESQAQPYPSLENSVRFWGIHESKDDTVAEEYWSRGLDTTDIPWEILEAYAKQDVRLTWLLFEKQKEEQTKRSSDGKNPNFGRLVSLVNQDTRVLLEMEWNGLRLDVSGIDENISKLKDEKQKIDEELFDLFGSRLLNFNSPDHISRVIYGGAVELVELIPYQHTFKTGKRAGETVERFRRVRTTVVFPRLVEPLPDTEMEKDSTMFSTAEPILKQLRPRSAKAKRVIELLLRRAKVEQLLSTFFEGWTRKIEEMDWPAGEIHSQFNQSVVVTGRLSSNGPNQQNVPNEFAKYIVSRFT